MAGGGRKPKAEDAKVNRAPATHEWTEVADRPFTGKRPRLPAELPAATREWWERLTRLAHCVLWDDGDWQFALDTARVHAAFANGDMARAAELRLRERQMGSTRDARRDLRIRYVAPEPKAPRRAPPAGITDFESERARRLLDAG